MIEIWNKRHIKYKLEWYNGSLDFPCDFCHSNSYSNFHIHVGDNQITVCEYCLNKARGEP